MIAFMIGITIMLVGIYIVVLEKSPFRRLLSLIVMNNGINLLFIALSYVAGIAVAQAIVITSIVINFSITLLGLVMLIKLKEIR